MANFLVKAEPTTYGLNHLEKDGSTTWDGIRNPVANKNLRTMKPGDAVLVYHTGDEKAVVGLAQVTSEPRPDPSEPSATVVGMKFVARAATPLALADIKKDALFADFALVRQSRLSVMPVPGACWAEILKRTGLSTGRKK